MTKDRITAVLELTLAGALWGFGFIAAIWALRSMGPLTLTGFRFLIAVVVGYAITLSVPALRRTLTRQQFWLAMAPGLILSATLVLQTWGLRYTTATKSGFITTLYVLLVPLLETFWLKRKLPRYHLWFVTAALIGVALICDLHLVFLESTKTIDPTGILANEAKQSLNIGDWLTLACSIFASLHILWFALIHDRITSSFAFNLHQSFWAGILPLILSVFIETWPTGSTILPEAWAGLLSLALGSTLIAFSLQVKAQKTIPPSLASLLFLLESPFAALFAIYFLHERLTSENWAGAGLILAAVALSSMFASESTENVFEEPEDVGAGSVESTLESSKKV